MRREGEISQKLSKIPKIGITNEREFKDLSRMDFWYFHFKTITDNQI